MIVTRQRRKPFPWKRTLSALGFLVLLVWALAWTPSRTWLATGPVTAPIWNATAPVWKPIAKPFDMAAQQGAISAQTAEIQELQKQLAQAQSQVADRDKQITQLQSQLDRTAEDAATAHASGLKGGVTPNATPASIPVVSDLSQQATTDMRRTAQVWGSMDSEAAAKVVQKLPDAYVARIFALMLPDAVGAILENLPAGYAARLTAEHPELKR